MNFNIPVFVMNSYAFEIPDFFIWYMWAGLTVSLCLMFLLKGCNTLEDNDIPICILASFIWPILICLALVLWINGDELYRKPMKKDEKSVKA